VLPVNKVSCLKTLREALTTANDYDTFHLYLLSDLKIFLEICFSVYWISKTSWRGKQTLKKL